MCNPGDCFIIEPQRQGGYSSHLFVMVIPFYSDSEKTILVSFSSTAGQPRHDTTVVINNPHPRLPNESYAAYYLTLVVSKTRLNEYIRYGIAIPVEPASPEVVESVRIGILETDDIDIGIQELYRDYLFDTLD